MDAQPNGSHSAEWPPLDPDRPRFVVLVTTGIGGSERRFADIVAAMNARGCRTSLVVPEGIRRDLLGSCGLDSHQVIGIGKKDDGLFNFLRGYNSWLSRYRRTEASFHYPLNCLFPLHAKMPHWVTASLTDVRAPTALPSRDRRAWKYYGILRYAEFIDVLNPEVLRQTRALYPQYARKVVQTPNGTFVDPLRFSLAAPDPRIVFMARLVPGRKGIEELLELAPGLQAHVQGRMRVRVPLRVVGDGPISGEVRERVATLRRAGVDISYEGFLPGPTAMSGASVALSLQPENNYPSRVVAEALLSGVSVVIRDTGESRLFGSPPGISYVPASLTADSLGAAVVDALVLRRREGFAEEIREAAVAAFHSDGVPAYLQRLMSPTAVGLWAP